MSKIKEKMTKRRLNLGNVAMIACLAVVVMFTGCDKESDSNKAVNFAKEICEKCEKIETENEYFDCENAVRKKYSSLFVVTEEEPYHWDFKNSSDEEAAYNWFKKNCR